MNRVGTFPVQPSHSRLSLVAEELGDFFKAIGLTNVVVAVGWKKRTEQINQGKGGAMRVVLDDTGEDGAYDAATQPGGNPRPLYTWKRSIRISVWAYDGSNPADEQKQIEAAETLKEAVFQGVHRSSYGQFHPKKSRRTENPPERAFGCEFLITADLHGPMNDRALGVVKPVVVKIKTNLDGGGS